MILHLFFYKTQIVANTVLEKKYERPLTATEKLTKERLQKRKWRAIKNGQKLRLKHIT